jgi:hypothetical protein
VTIHHGGKISPTQPSKEEKNSISILNAQTVRYYGTSTKVNVNLVFFLQLYWW